MWKGHGPTDVSWDQVPQCPDPRRTGRVLQPHRRLQRQRRHDHRLQHRRLQRVPRPASDQPAPPPTAAAYDYTTAVTTPAVPVVEAPAAEVPAALAVRAAEAGSGSGGSNRTRQRDRYEYRGNQTPQIFGQTNVTFSENGTDACRRPTSRKIADDDDTHLVPARLRQRASSSISNRTECSELQESAGLREPRGTRGQHLQGDIAGRRRWQAQRVRRP